MFAGFEEQEVVRKMEGAGIMKERQKGMWR